MVPIRGWGESQKKGRWGIQSDARAALRLRCATSRTYFCATALLATPPPADFTQTVVGLSVIVPRKAQLPALTGVAVASVAAPSLNVTVPSGTPVAGATGLTVALSVTAWPTVEGLGVEVRLVVVAGRTKSLPVIEKRLVWTVLTPGPPTLGPV